MNIHEYQSKNLFRGYNIPVPAGQMAMSSKMAARFAETFDRDSFVVKAQIHAGGRGKGGGVQIVKSVEGVRRTATELLGRPLITPQTDPEGKIVNKVLVEEGLSIDQELYLGILVDRALARVLVLMSASGGMDIEEVAEKDPGALHKVAVHPALGLTAFQARELLFNCGVPAAMVRHGVRLLINLYRLFIDLDASLVEINPLVITTGRQWVAADAKIAFDDSAVLRHPEVKDLTDPLEVDPLELEAHRYGLNYVRLDGQVGTMVNGAGLAMATMDLIQQAGAEPANFLDVGGGASASMVAQGFRIILGDPNVKAILINIFGGILRCDVLAEGVISAVKEVGVKVPVVVRLEGTNVEQGRKLLDESGLDFMVASSLPEVAEKIGAVVKGN